MRRRRTQPLKRISGATLLTPYTVLVLLQDGEELPGREEKGPLAGCRLPGTAEIPSRRWAIGPQKYALDRGNTETLPPLDNDNERKSDSYRSVRRRRTFNQWSASLGQCLRTRRAVLVPLEDGEESPVRKRGGLWQAAAFQPRLPPRSARRSAARAYAWRRPQEEYEGSGAANEGQASTDGRGQIADC